MQMQMSKLTIATITIAAIAAMTTTAGAVPSKLPVQGTLTRSNGALVQGPTVIQFRLYDAPSGGTPLFEETFTLEVDQGAFTAYLGSSVAVPLGIFSGGPVFLGITAGTDMEMTPRFEIGSVPYAARSADSELLAGQAPNAFATASHNHNGTYLPLGTTLACTGTNKVTGINAAGNVTCAADTNTTYTAAGTGGLSLSGANAFSIAADGVTTARIADGNVTTAKIADGDVTTAKIADGNVTTAKIADGDVTTNKIGNDQVTSAKLGRILPGTRTLINPPVISVGGTAQSHDEPMATWDLCVLALASISNSGTCSVTISGSNWRVTADSSTSAGSLAQCHMMCFAW
jgi:hypothetical protein